MPKIPDAYALGDRPIPQATPSRADFSTPTTGEALGQLGQTVAKIGQQFEQQQAQQQVFAARRALNDWEQKNLYDPETGAVTKKGSAAFGLPQQLGDSFDKMTGQIAGTLTGREAQAAFQELAINRKASVMDWAGRYAAGEHLQFNADEYKADIASSAQRAATDPGVLPLELAAQQHRTEGYLSSIGASESQKQEAIAKAHGETVFGATENLLANGKWQDAQKVFEQYGKTLTPEQQYAVSNKIDADAAPDVADGIYAKHGGNLTAALKEANGIGKSTLRHAVETQLRYQYSLDQAGRRENLSLLVDTANQGMEALQSGAPITPTVLGQIQQNITALRSQGNDASGIAARRIADRLDGMYQNAGLVAQMSAMPLPDQQAFVQHQLASLPQGADLATAARNAEAATFLRGAYNKNVDQINKDPYGFYAKQTGETVEPLAPSGNAIGDIYQQLAARIPIASKIEARWQVNPGLLNQQEQQQINATVNALPPADRAHFFTKMAQLPDGGTGVVARTLGDFAKADPLLGMTAAYGVAGKEDVATRIARGSDLIKSGGFKLNTDLDKSTFVSDFATKTGDMFAGDAAARQAAIAGVTAIYATLADDAGGTKQAGTYSGDLLKQATDKFFGTTKASVNSTDVMPPYGMNSGTFQQQAPKALQQALTAQPGWDAVKIRSAASNAKPRQIGNDGYVWTVVGNDGIPAYIADMKADPTGRTPLVTTVQPPAPLAAGASPGSDAWQYVQ